jgi:beta-phosphoglucomutase
MTAACTLAFTLADNSYESKFTSERVQHLHYQRMREHTQALLWDMNGVLVDDEPIQERIWIQTLSEHGFVREGEWWREQCMGRKIGSVLRELFPALNDDDLFKTVVTRKRRRYREIVARGRLPVVAGAVELVRAAAAAGLPQAVVTSASAAELNLIVDHLRIRCHFQTLISGEDVLESKPSPEGYILAATRLGVDVRACWILEDSLAGVEATKAAGANVVAITTSLSADELDGAGADIVVSKFELSLLERLL